ncbi:MAG: hypothetical protein FJ271_27000 [Planctomycetes bacterium]|nr:hypothetical protein [Planctomycetota bacterium]
MTRSALLWLERLTALTLLLVIAALGWMILAEDLPTWLRLATAEAEVIVVGSLLVIALALVSALALWHTR